MNDDLEQNKIKNGKDSYHHKNLKEALITAGIDMIYRDGIGAFSLRKLSKKVGVSPTACYNHFKNLEDLLQSIFNFISEQFAQALCEAVEKNEYNSITISMGCEYVKFFAEHPNYFSLLFDSKSLGIEIGEDHIDSSPIFSPMEIFKENALKELRTFQIPEEELRDDLLIMWGAVHGLAAMANMRGIHYEGDWVSLTENLLRRKIML